MKFKLALAIAINQDLRPNNVGREKVRRELDSFEFQIKSATHGVDERCLSEPGNPFQNHMTATGDGNQNIGYDFLLTDNEFGYFVADAVKFFDKLGDLLFCLFG